MSSDFSRPVDAWSRFVAYCSLVIALGTLGWVWLSGGDSLLNPPNGTANSLADSPDVAAFQKLFDEESATRQQRDQEMREAWRLEQQNQLQSYKTAADEMLAQHQLLITQLNGSVQPATFAAAATPVEGESDESTKSTTDDDSVADATESKDGTESKDDEVTNEKIAEMRPTDSLTLTGPAGSEKASAELDQEDESTAFFSPLLTQVITTQKTDGTNEEHGIVVVRNTGSGKAMLARIEFTPSNDYDAIFEVDAPISLSAEDDDDVVEIIFSEQDNLADESGKHGIYKRQLSPTAFGVNGGEAMRIRLAIANEKHIGWGFRGQLKISYNGPDALVIEDAELVFINASQPIVQK